MSALHIFLKIANVLTYLFLLSGTIYTAVGPTPDKEVVLDYLTYLTPAAWIQWVWVLVHALLGGFVIYQWFEPAQELAIRGVGWHFVIPSLLNGIFLALWFKGYLVLAWITILITASSVSYVFYNLEKNYPAQTIFDKIFIHAPFSLWHGWIIFLTVVSTFAAFTSVSDDGPNVLHIVLVEIGLFVLASTAVGYTEFKKSRGDVLGALVIALGLYAIFAEQESHVIHWSALGFALFATIYPSRPYIFRLLGYGVSEETAPLLG